MCDGAVRKAAPVVGSNWSKMSPREGVGATANSNPTILIGVKQLVVLLLALLPSNAFASLDIYWIDVEGGASTLIVTDAGQSVLMDAGYAGLNDRDVDRIEHVIREEAGLDHIDYFLTSHFHGDHVGGLAALADRIDIRGFVDHGDSVDKDSGDGKVLWEAYLATVGDKRRTVTPGETLELEGVQLVIVSADGKTLIESLPGAGAVNPRCASYEPKPDDQGENGRSVGYFLKAGDFEFVNLGDLSWSFQYKLACPVNVLGEVDLYQATHHGVRDDVLPQQMWSMRPTVAVMNNGPTKGGGPQAIEYVLDSPGLEGFWQLHRPVNNDDAHHAHEQFIANLGETDGCDGHWLRARVEPTGTYTLTNSRTGFSKTYQTK